MPKDRLLPGEELPKDKPLVSANGRYRLVFQGDGNLVLYEGNHPWWDTKTVNPRATQCIMQRDGNLVIYAGPNRPIWSSTTGGNPGNPGSWLLVQDDRNVVIYRPIWASNSYI
jgi:hypothetical protein